jgi:hypothetical protein
VNRKAQSRAARGDMRGGGASANGISLGIYSVLLQVVEQGKDGCGDGRRLGSGEFRDMIADRVEMERRWRGLSARHVSAEWSDVG